jgi:Protein of unknown function (DUF1552)
MNPLRMNRRHFLKAVGATALTYPFLRGVPSYADSTAAPQYLVLVFTPCGVVRHLWGAQGPRPTGTTPTVTSGLTFRPTLAPFAPLADQVIVLDGLAATAANGSHEAGMAALWTGQTSSGNPATSPSIDQVVAQKLAAGRPFDTIPLMVRSSADFTDREVKTRMIYSAAGGFVDPYDDPVAARSTLFPNVAATMPSSSAPAGPDKTTFIRAKVLAQTNSELTSLQGRLCTEDRVQLQNLQAAWNDLDQQLQQAATASASCASPAAAPAGYAAPSADFPTSAKLQMDILAMALACDLTRLASLQFSTATSQVTHSWIDSTQTDTHHDYSHDGPSSLYSLGPDFYAYPPAAQFASGLSPYAPQLTGIDLWYATQVAYLATRLSQFSAGGKSLLAQSVICWGSELDMGAAHNHDDTPFVLIGGGGGRLKTNQVVRFPLKLDADPTTSGVVDRAHNDLLLTLAKVMGVDLGGVFGTASYCTGPIAEILT